VQDGFMSNFLCNMKEGDKISCQGPFGDFILRPPLHDAIFIATGTGVAPFRSMLDWLFVDQSRHQNKEFWLLFGNRHEQESTTTVNGSASLLNAPTLTTCRR
jgi:ferredoxin-NADP reductase